MVANYSKAVGLAIVAACCAGPAAAALKVGDEAPDFTLQASHAGKDTTFSLKDALKKGPVVVYFYPAAYTSGCNVEAHTFAEAKGKFDAAGATIIGVSQDSIRRLNDFSKDPEYCAGQFTVASDADGKVTRAFDLKVREAKAGMKDSRGMELDHAFSERTTFVITRDHKIAATFSSADDGIKPQDHVEKSLAVVEQLPRKTAAKS
jgi:thioredoxin-dependent peroxiredoxin